MAFPRSTTAVVSASVILFVYWTTSAAQSHDPSPANLSALRRFKRELDATTKEQVQSGFKVGVDFLTTVTEVVNQIDKEKLSSVLKGLANFASLAPGIGSLVCSVVNVVLAFIPQENAIEELRNGFSEVNRRLDSLAIQISDLATDVEWFNFASVYSRDENRILNAWMKFDELQLNLRLVANEEEKLRLAEIFTSYYENSGTEGSVSNIYHYLTVSGTSLSRNINSLLKEKFKCSIREMGRYNIYLSSLLWRGMVLNQLYWKLIGFNAERKQEEHNNMFKNVFKVQNDALQFCLDNYEQYLDKDVEEVSKRFATDQKQKIADNVRKTLDQKYFWYNWAVVVYELEKEENYKLVHMRRIPVGNIVVAVGYTSKEMSTNQGEVTSAASRCFANTQCSDIERNSMMCLLTDIPSDIWLPEDHNLAKFTGNAKILHYFYYYIPVMSPQPFFNGVDCSLDGYDYKVNVYLSKRLPVCTSANVCLNGGQCKRLMDSNEQLCDCPDGYYGNRCENATSNFQDINIGFLVPDTTTINIKLDQLNKKLDRIMTLCQGH